MSGLVAGLQHLERAKLSSLLRERLERKVGVERGSFVRALGKVGTGLKDSMHSEVFYFLLNELKELKIEDDYWMLWCLADALDDLSEGIACEACSEQILRFQEIVFSGRDGSFYLLRHLGKACSGQESPARLKMALRLIEKLRAEDDYEIRRHFASALYAIGNGKRLSTRSSPPLRFFLNKDVSSQSRLLAIPVDELTALTPDSMTASNE